jgi:hypothetical protein
MDCTCHQGPNYPCNVPGGCGSEGCGRERAGACILCPIFYADRNPRIPDRKPVCDGCRFRLSKEIADISRYHRLLLNPDPVEYDDRWYEYTGKEWDAEAKEWVAFTEDRRTDPLGAIGGVAPIPSRTKQPSVSGSRDKPIPVSADMLDLTAGARQFNPTRDRLDQPNQKPDDAVGHLSAATILDSWARDWRDTLFPDLHLPAANVDELVRWLRVGADPDNPGTRIDEACDGHPAIDEFADEIHRLRQALRRATGDTNAQPEMLDGVACRNCDTRALMREPGSQYISCGVCESLLTEAEYREWVGLLAAAVRQ